MTAVGKKLHHFVPRFYLKAWTAEDLIYCLGDGEIFRTTVRNVGAENHFYDLQELSPQDIAFVREIAIADSPDGLKPLHEQLLWAFTLPHATRKKLEVSGRSTAELLATIDNLIAEMNENIHSSIEDDFKPYLDAMLAGNLDFYSDPQQGPVFFRGLAAQYLRTNQIKKAEMTLKKEVLEIFQRVVNVLVHICAINLGRSLFLSRDRYEIFLLDNETEVEFITADQPVINIAAKPKETKPPEKFDLYYPLSPRKTMLLLETASSHRPDSSSVSAMSAHLYNLHVGAHSYQQIFAKSPQELESIRTELPAFRTCF